MPKASAAEVCDARNDAMLPKAGHQKKKWQPLRVLFTMPAKN
jgi:hypothetical protein